MIEQESPDDEYNRSYDSISRLKTRRREEISNFRKQGRDNAYRRRRLNILEAEALVTNIPLSQFKELVLNITKRKPSLDILRIIKNNCSSLPYIESFFRTPGAFDSLLRLLIRHDGPLQLESAACITNLACGSHKASRRVANGAGSYLVTFMSGKSPYLQSQCIWAVGNIAHDCFDCFSILKAQGILPALLNALQSPYPEVIQSTVFTLNACTKYEDMDFKDLAAPNIRKFLLNLLKQENSPSKMDAAFCLVNIYCLCVKNNLQIYYEEVVELLEILCEITSDEEDLNISVALPLIHCLGFLSSSDTLCELLYKQKNFHDLSIKILSNKILMKEMIWVLTNIATINHEDKLESNIVHKTIEHLQSPTETLTIMDLYFLCILATQSEDMKSKLRQTQIVAKVNHLSHCGKKSTEHACNLFLDIINAKL